MTTFSLACACGSVTGSLDADPPVGTHGICYCDDCQAYARWLGRDDLLDPYGGTEVVQTWPARVRFEGADVALVRLSPKGLFRWYAACCRTPLANSLGAPRLPFVGVVARCVVERDALTPTFGPPWGVQGRFAPGGCPPNAHASATIGVLATAAALLARGAWHGAHTPNSLLGREPRAPTTVLTAEERAALAP